MSMPFVRQGYHPKDDDYYIILDVDFNASQETISSAYKNLARKYHPDKNNQDERSRKQAQFIFEKIKTAYEVLSDPRKRQIYDTLGPEGLKLDGWKMVRKQMTAEEIRDEYQRLLRQSVENKMAIVAKPRASFTMAIDASDLFNKHRLEELDELEEEELTDDFEVKAIMQSIPTIEISSMSASMSFENSIATNHALILNGNLNAKNGTGDGSLGATYRYKHSKATQYDVLYQLGAGPLLSAGITRKLNEQTSVSARGFLIMHKYGIAPCAKFTITHRIRNYLIGSVSYKEAIDSSVTTSLIYRNEALMFEITTSYKLSQIHHRASVDFGYTFNNNESRLTVSVVASSNEGLAVEYGCETRILEINVIGAALSLSVSAGVTLKIRYNRANQEFNMPIYLSDEIQSAPLFYGTMVPLVSYYILDRCYLRHYTKVR